MAIVSDVEIRLRADIARLQQDMTAARSTVDRAMNGISAAAGGAVKALGLLGVGIGLKELVMKVVEAQREFDKLNAGLVTATGSTANAAQAFKALQQFAATTPYSVQDATEAFIKLRNLGLDPSEKALRSYGNTAASQGKSLNQFIEAVADASTGEFERLKEFGIKAKQNGDLVSLTFQGVTKNIGNNAKDIQAYLMKIGEVDFAGAMERRANTLDGVISNLGDSWQAFLLRISQNGIGQVLASTLLAVGNSLSDLGDILEIVGGKADTEGGKIKEATAVHVALTGAIKVVATAGVVLGVTIKELGEEFGALAAVLYAFSQGDFDGIKRVMAARLQDAKDNSKWAADKIKAIWNSTDQANAARDAETANTKKNNKDQLAQFAVVLSADEKRANALVALIDVRKKLLGIDPQDLADRKKIQTALDTGAISQAEYNQLMAQSTKEMQANSLAYKQSIKNLDGQAEAINRASQAQQLLNQQTVQRIAFLKQSGQLDDESAINRTADTEVAGLRQQIEAQNKLLAIAKQRQDSQKEQAAVRGEIASLKTKIDNEEEKRLQDLLLLDQQRYKVAIDNTANLIEAAQAQTLVEKAKSRDMQDEIDTLGLTGVALANVTAARLRDQAAALDRRAEIGIIDEVNDKLRQQADELRKQADLGLTKARVEEQQKFWGDIEQTAHDTFLSIGDGSKDTWTRLRDSAKNIFFNWLYQMTLKKWIVQIGASIDGTSAVAGIAGATSGGSGSNLTSLSGLYTAGTGIYKAISGGFAELSTSVADAVQAGLYSTGLTDQIASNGAFATGVGNSIPYVAAAVASYYLGHAIAGGYKIGGTGLANTINSLGVVGGLLNRAFGMRDKQYSDSSTLTGTLSAAGLAASVNTAYTQKGGWFRSDRSGVDSSAVDSATASAISGAYTAIQTATAGYAKLLGVNADTIATRTEQLNITLGKDATANEKAISDYLAGVSDAIAQGLLPNLADFQQSGETLSVTFQRLAADAVSVSAILGTMGSSDAKAFGTVGAAAVAMREDLLSLVGGLQNLSTQVQYINDNFLTTAEKAQPLQAEIQAQFDALGFSNIKTVEQYKNVVMQLVNNGALATEEGRKQYATLLALAPAFKQVSDYLLSVQQAAKDSAASALDVLSKAVDRQKDIVTAAYDNAMAVLSARIDTVNAAISKTTELSAALKDALVGIASPEQMVASRAAAQAQIGAAIAIARASGVLLSASDLADALNAVKQDPANQFSSYADYLREVAATNRQLQDLGGLSDDQLDTAQLQLQVLQDQQTQAAAAHTEDLARLDAIVTSAQQIIDQVNHLDTSAVTIGSALVAFSGALYELQAANAAITVQPHRALGVATTADDLQSSLQQLIALTQSVAATNGSTAKNMQQLTQQFDSASAGGSALIVEMA